MRLHLPKRLLHAVLTALVTTPAALFTLGSNAYAGYVQNVTTFYLNGSNSQDFNQNLTYAPSDTDADGDYYNAYGTFKNGKYTLNTNPTTTSGNYINTISTGEKVSATIETLNVTNNKSLSIGAGGNGVFTGGGLVIEKFEIENSGTATLSVGNATECHKVTINSVTGTLNIVNYSNLTISGGESAINLGTVALNGGSITNTGTLNLTGAVSMTEAYVKGNIMGDLATGTTNGFGTFSSIALSDLFKGGGTVTVGDSVSWTMGDSTLTYTAASQSFSLANTLTSTIYQVHSNYTVGSGASGATSIQIYGTESSTTTLTLSSSLPSTVKSIVANRHTVFDISGVNTNTYELVLNGGTLTNTGEEGNVGKTKAQLCRMSVTADSVITATNGHSFGYVASEWKPTEIFLNGHTLTKKGDGEFFAASTTLCGGGTLKIENGTFTLGFTASDTDRIGFIGHEADSTNTNVWLTGGTLDGIFTVQRDAEIKAEGGTGTVSAKITLAEGKTATFKATGSTDGLSVTNILSGSGSVSVTGGGTVELSGTNTYTGGTKLSGGHLTVGNASALGGNTGISNQVLSFSGSSTLTVNTDITLAATGKIQASGANADLDISGNVNLTGQINVADAVGRVNITGGTTSLLGSDGRIWLMKDSAVTISKGANLVTKVFSFTGNNDVSAGEITSIGNDKIEVVENAGAAVSEWSKNTDYINTNFKDLDVKYTSTAGRVVKANMDNVALSTAAGAGKLTLAREGGVTLTGLTANSDVELATATTVTGITSIKKGATLSVSDAQSSLNKLSGSGKLSASVNQTLSLNTDTSNLFNGTLETKGGKLNVTGGTEYVLLTGMVADGGDLDLLSSTNVIISEVLSIGDGSTVGVYTGTTASPTEEGKVFVNGITSAKAQLTVGTGAKLYADLSLSNAILTFEGNALTLGSSLTLLSGNELKGVLYTGWDGSGTLDLFTGVDSLTLGSGDTAITAKVGETYDASSVFANEGMDNYKLQIVGSAGNYTVQMVQNAPTPEPTTATLSLLALMGLAARRRRKA